MTGTVPRGSRQEPTETGSLRHAAQRLDKFRRMSPDARRTALRRRAEKAIGWTASMNPAKRLTYFSYLPDSIREFGARPDFVRSLHRWTDGKAQNAGDLSRLLLLLHNADRVLSEQIPGDFAELGVHRGQSAAVLADVLATATGRQFHLFDTFEGFDERDLHGVDSGKTRLYADTSLDAVRRRIGHGGICLYHPGHFPDSAANVPAGTTFSLVHLDCDLYDPTLAALEFFYPSTSPGGFLIVHDYSSGHWPGVTKAVDEFLADKPEHVVLMPDKSGTAIVRRCARCAGRGNSVIIS